MPKERFNNTFENKIIENDKFNKYDNIKHIEYREKPRNEY